MRGWTNANSWNNKLGSDELLYRIHIPEGAGLASHRCSREVRPGDPRAELSFWHIYPETLALGVQLTVTQWGEADSPGHSHSVDVLS